MGNKIYIHKVKTLNHEVHEEWSKARGEAFREVNSAPLVEPALGCYKGLFKLTKRASI